MSTARLPFPIRLLKEKCLPDNPTGTSLALAMQPFILESDKKL